MNEFVLTVNAVWGWRSSAARAEERWWRVRTSNGSRGGEAAPGSERSGGGRGGGGGRRRAVAVAVAEVAKDVNEAAALTDERRCLRRWRKARTRRWRSRTRWRLWTSGRGRGRGGGGCGRGGGARGDGGWHSDAVRSSQVGRVRPRDFYGSVGPGSERNISLQRLTHPTHF
uniref:Uncharacterized protein n=1 Tax=Oryza sativa subsp. japonica TaxID=39947 RepID=Q94LT6_ORYSJ|nr:hypothetical protein [Oryza sativa Japonica Group]